MRGILAILRLFLILSVAMYLPGGAVNTSTRTPSSMSETFYFCAVTALTIRSASIEAHARSGTEIVEYPGHATTSMPHWRHVFISR